MLIAYDRDQAGDRAAAKLAGRLGSEGVECFRVLFPQGQDANSFAVGVDDPAGALAELLRTAVWLGSADARVKAGAGPGRLAGSRAAGRSADYQGAGSRREPFVDIGDAGRVDIEATVEPASSSSLAAEPSEELRLGKGTDPEPSPTSSVSASPVPAGPPVGPVARLEGEELRVQIDGRGWRVRGLGKVTSFEVLRLNVLVAGGAHEHRGHLFHVDRLRSLSARARGVFCSAGRVRFSAWTVERSPATSAACCWFARSGRRKRSWPRKRPKNRRSVLSDTERTAALGRLSDPGSSRPDRR